MQNNRTSLLGDEIDKEIIVLIQQQGKLNAVKFCKEYSGWELEASKEYVELLEAENAATKGKPVVINRGGLRGCMFFPGLIFCLIWVCFCAIIPLMIHNETFPSPNESWFKPIIYSAFGIFSLPGFIFLIVLARKEYDEKIEISTREVSYFKKGWLQKTQEWYEPLMNYKGIAVKLDDGVEDTSIYLVVLQHQFDKKKDIILKESAKDEAEQMIMQEEYAKLLKLPLLKDFVESESAKWYKKFSVWTIIMVLVFTTIFLYFYFKTPQPKPSNYYDEPYAP